VTAPGDVVLDTFVGSGTTILAAERVGRRALALEPIRKMPTSPCGVGRRLQSVTPTHAEMGLIFDDLQKQRG
jgi:hypothetical protein